jgi:tetratricopeptide (TPR) repeat protein
MKTLIRKSILVASVVLLASTFTLAQRVIKGTVYREGKPAAGVTVEAHKGATMMTSFDGKYEVAADAKSKWLKFTFIDEVKRLDLAEDAGDEIDFLFDDIKPGGEANEENSAEIVLKTQEELLNAQDKDYANEFTLYNEFYNQEDYTSALPHWKNLYNKYPKSHTNLYIQGTKMYQNFIDSAKTSEEKEKYLQELMKIYDKRVKYFGQKGYVLGRKGTDWFKYKLAENLEGDNLKQALKSGYEWISESVNEQGINSEAPVLVLLMNSSRSLFQMGEISKETVVANYDKCTNIINQVIANEKDAERLGRFKQIQPYIEEIFGRSGAADCEALVNIFTPQYQEKSNDVEFIKAMLDRLRRAKCDESELFSNATEKLYELEPSAVAAFNMAHRYLKLDDITKAKEYYKQAMEQETDKELLATYYYEYATVLYAKESAYSEARNYARKTLEIKPGYCDALMLIGDIYVAASRSFGNSNLEKASVFWAAVDYYNKARNGEDCAMDAAQKISEYRRHFPNKEDAFMEGLQAGQSYKVGGWINETTTVRF